MVPKSGEALVQEKSGYFVIFCNPNLKTEKLNHENVKQSNPDSPGCGICKKVTHSDCGFYIRDIIGLGQLIPLKHIFSVKDIEFGRNTTINKI